MLPTETSQDTAILMQTGWPVTRQMDTDIDMRTLHGVITKLFRALVSNQDMFCIL